MTTQTSDMVQISDFPKEPLEMFKQLLERVDNKFITMNLATLDKEFGVLNRTVVYRGLINNAITFVTERNSRKYENLKENPKLGLTMLFTNVVQEAQDISQPPGGAVTWQVRLINAEAVELSDEQIAELWQEEPLFAKIRSYICECGKPVNHEQLIQQHDKLLQDCQSGANKLEQTKSYTAFQIFPQRWDFYKTEADKIADRIQYIKKSKDATDQWEVLHVAA